MVLFVEAISQLLNLSFFVIPNVYVLVRPCGWRDDIVLWSAFASWTCWNTLFLMSVVRTLRLSSCQLWHHDLDVDGHILLPFACLLLFYTLGLASALCAAFASLVGSILLCSTSRLCCGVHPLLCLQCRLYYFLLNVSLPDVSAAPYPQRNQLCPS